MKHMWNNEQKDKHSYHVSSIVFPFFLNSIPIKTLFVDITTSS